MDLTDQDVALIGALQQVLRNSNLPIRRPSTQQPTFWDYPICPTRIEPVAGGSGWINFLEIDGLVSTTHRVNGYVAAPFGDAALASVEFRFLFNGTLAPNMTLANGVDHNKISTTTFPMVPQSTAFFVNEKDRLTLQVRNTGVFAQLVCAAFFGWRFNNPLGIEKGPGSVITDDT